jgi:hypothetical protein
MNILNPIRKIKIKSLTAFILLTACVERIDFNAPAAQLLTVIEGAISDSPGPYIVKISKGLYLDQDSSSLIAVQKAKVKLYDDLGNVEDFKEADDPGVYKTGGTIQGQIGRTYHIVIETQEGKIFESDPDRLNSSGEIEKISFEFESRAIIEKFGEVNADVFNIYVDANAASGDENYAQWRLTGTYRVVTNPELHETWIPPYRPYKDPWPRSGYIVTEGPDFSGGLLKQIGDCTCCVCWVKQFETIPQLSDAQFVNSNQFKRVKVGQISINSITFFDKYLLEVEQMSLTRKSYEFFKLVRSQKEGASNLFQPPSGEIKGNIQAINSTEPIVGIFWATSIKKKSIFINTSDVPYPVPPPNIDTFPCAHYPNSSITKPVLWE